MADFAAPVSGTAGTTTRNQVLIGAALTGLSVLMLVLMWPMFGDLWWLAPVAFVPMYLAQYRLLPRRWSFVPVAAAFGAYGFGLAILGSSIAGPLVIAAGVVALAALGAAVGVVQRPFSERTNYRWFVVQLPIVWLILEVTIQENEIIGTYPWLAYRLSDAPMLASPVSTTGTPALSFLLMVVNAGIALVILRWLDVHRPDLATVPVPRLSTRSAWSSVSTWTFPTVPSAALSKVALRLWPHRASTSPRSPTSAPPRRCFGRWKTEWAL